MRFVALWTVAIAVAGCGVENDFSHPNQTDFWYQGENNEIDILWVVDDSCSMTEEQVALSNGFATFILEMEHSGTDFHIGVVTTSTDTLDDSALRGSPSYLTPDDDYLRAFQERAYVGIGGSDKEKGFEAAVRALSPELSATNNGFLRDTAQLQVIVVTDEEDCSDGGALDDEQDARECYKQPEALLPVADYIGRLQAYKDDPGMVQVSGIVGNIHCEDAWPGRRYAEAARLSAGIIGDICNDDWSHVLFDLGSNASGVRSKFLLSKGVLAGTLQVFVDDELITESEVRGWTYDAETRYLTFHGTSIPARGAEIRAEYTVGSG